MRRPAWSDLDQQPPSKRARYDDPANYPPPQDPLDQRELCRDFLNGTCNRGTNRCRYRHPPPQYHANSQNNYYYPPLVSDVIAPMQNTAAPPDVQDIAQNVLLQNMVRNLLANTLNNMLTHNPNLRPAETIPEYPPPPVVHPPEWSIHACRDFAKNKCSNERCKFAHVVNLEDCLEGTIFDPITCCYDFLNSACDNPRCRYAHILNWPALEARRREPARPPRCAPPFRGNPNHSSFPRR